MLYHPEWKAPGDALYIFTHIPKCAGSTFREQVRATFGTSLLAPYHNPLREEFLKWERAPRSQYHFLSSHNPYGIHRKFERTPVYLSLTRDPVERYLSFFWFMKNHPKAPHHAVIKDCTLADSIGYFTEQKTPLFFNQQCRYLSGGEPSFEAAKKRIEADYLLVADMRQYDQFIELLFRVNILRSRGYEIVNVGKRGDKDKPAVQQDIDRIREANQEDIVLVDYVCRIFDELYAALHDSKPAGS